MIDVLPKPRIHLTKHCKSSKKWCCHDNYYTSGYGDTPALAYADWLMRHSTISRIPRASRNKHGYLVGIWNRKDVLAWQRNGCPPMRVYLGTRQIIGYEPTSDTFLLRGF